MKPDDVERGALADAILRRLVAEDGYVGVERYPNGGIAGLIESSWFTLTEAEANYLDSLRAEAP